jgi:predicted enzyme related to lactoylglutathione lyase
MDTKISYVILGVSDLARARAFYEAAFDARPSRSGGQLAAFDFAGVTVALMPHSMLAAMRGSSSPAGSGGALVQMARTRPDVDIALAAAQAAGGKVVQPAGEGPWGGYSGSFADPDGNVWSIACNIDFFKA